MVPPNAEDRRIRRELHLALARQQGLSDVGVSFIVTNADVSLTGVVPSDAARGHISDMAMDIAGVKSVANGLRVSP